MLFHGVYSSALAARGGIREGEGPRVAYTGRGPESTANENTTERGLLPGLAEDRLRRPPVQLLERPPRDQNP